MRYLAVVSLIAAVMAMGFALGRYSDAPCDVCVTSNGITDCH